MFETVLSETIFGPFLIFSWRHPQKGMARRGRPIIFHRAALKKGTNASLRFSAGSCGFLRKSCENLRFPCENLRFPNALFSRGRRESAKICENLRKSAFGLGLSPQVCPLKRALISQIVKDNQTCTKCRIPFCVCRLRPPPVFPKGIWPFAGTGNPPLSVRSPTISTGSRV